LKFTIYYTVVITPVLLLVSFGLALLTQQTRRGVGFFRTAYFLPVVLGLNAASLIWLWLYNDDVGIINALARRIHLLHGPLIWFTSFTSTLIAICIMIIWKTSGFSMILLTSGMQAISQELYGSARVDGANALQRMWYITLPLLRRTFALTLTLSVIGSFLAFDQFFIMSKGGPQNQTITTVYWIYNQAFTQYHLGYGSALAIVLLVLLVGVSVVQLYLLRDRD
jgi:multiple sugar transport system permease protein